MRFIASFLIIFALTACDNTDKSAYVNSNDIDIGTSKCQTNQGLDIIYVTSCRGKCSEYHRGRWVNGECKNGMMFRVKNELSAKEK